MSIFLTPIAMVDNLDEKFDEYPLNQGHYVYNWECEKCPLYRVAGGVRYPGF